MDHAEQTVSWRRHAEALVILAALVLMAYANSFTGFARDDRPLILEDARVHSVSRLHLREILVHNYAWPGFSGGLYRPLTTLSYLFNFAILGDSNQPAGYHWVNYLLHAANAFLVYLLALLLVRQYWPAFVCRRSVGFAPDLHRSGRLHRGAARRVGRPRSARLAPALRARCAGIRLAEGSLAGRDDGCRHGGGLLQGRRCDGIAAGGALRFHLARPPGPFPAGTGSRVRFVRLCRCLPCYVRAVVLRHDDAMEIPFVEQSDIGARVPHGPRYRHRRDRKILWLLVWPRTLSADYSYNQIPLFNWHSTAWQQWCAVAAVAGLLLLLAVCYRRSRTGFFLLAFSALTLLPAANLVVTTGTIMAERLLYLPAVGFAAAVAFGIHRLGRRLGLRPMAAAVALGAVGAAYGARTYQRNPDWQNDETLFASAAEAVPHSFRPHMSLAYSWYTQDPIFFQGAGDRAG